VRPQELITNRPFIGFTRHGKENRIDCDFVAGCDGYHGVCRRAIPAAALTIHEKAYPFGWLGIMSDTPPLPHLVYAYSERGFALASMRGSNRSRYYVQCSLDTNLDAWTDDRFWEELKARYPKSVADSIVIGPAIEKSIAPLRSFVAEPMRYGRLFLAGDSAHVVPPTGAKGLNLAFSDVFYLSRALTAHFKTRDDTYLERYSDMALRRAWNAIRLSWRLTHLLHTFPDESSLDRRIRENELEYLAASESALGSLAEQYVGLPFET
jgi:p-hydroxybenzoate 3-monooxygenase